MQCQLNYLFAQLSSFYCKYRSAKAPLGLISAAIVLTIALLLPAISSPFYLDDIPRIVENPDLRSLANLGSKIFFKPSQMTTAFGNDPSRPLVYFIYSVVYQLFGAQPSAFRSVNIVIHLMNTILLAIWIKNITLSFSSSSRKILVSCGALFFCLTPINLGTVHYAYALSDLLVTTWLIAFLLSSIALGKLFKRVFLITVFFALGLATKQLAAIFPLVFLIQVSLNPNRSKKKEDFWITSWLLLICGAYISFRYYYLGGIGDLEGRGELKPTISYLSIQPFVICKYLFLSLFPFGLCIDHAPNLDEISPIYWILSYAFFLFFLMIPALFFWRRKKPNLRYVSFFLMLFFIILAPTSSFLPTVDYMVERRMYPAHVPISALIGLIINTITRKAQRPFRYIFSGAIIGIFAIWVWKINSRGEMFKDPISIWKNVQVLYPKNIRARQALGSIFFEQGKYMQAMEQLKPVSEENDYMSSVTLGSIYAAKTSEYFDVGTAIKYYDRALQIQPRMPLAYYAKARLLQTIGDEDAAKELFLQTLSIDPRHADAANNLGSIYFSQNQLEKAAHLFQHAANYAKPIGANLSDTENSKLPIDDKRVPLANLATTYARLGRYDDAFALCQKILEILPQDSSCNATLGYLYEQKNWVRYDEEKSLLHLRKALELSYQFHNVFNLARKYQLLGDANLARGLYLEAIKLSPDDTDSLYHLALLELRAGNQSAAKEILKNAFDKAPHRLDIKKLFERIGPESADFK